METSIEEILTKELVGKQILIHKHTECDDVLYYYFRRLDVRSRLVHKGCDYAIITGIALNSNKIEGFRLKLKKTEFLPINWIDISYPCEFELKEKED